MTTIDTNAPAGAAVDRPFRLYAPDRDRAAAHRIWLETGWIEDTDFDREAMDIFLSGGRVVVAEMAGEPECLVETMAGTVRHGDADLPMSMVAAVTTSRIARKQGFAARLTAEAIAHDAADGALVSALGMFEQGFYNRLGFGSGGYVNRFGFVPSSITTPGATRAPRRLSLEDWEAVHANRLGRRMTHGACTVQSPQFTRTAMMEGRKAGFGLGYYDGPGGTLSHHVWIDPRGNVEEGPYFVLWMAWSTGEQFLELLGLLRNLGDQVRLIYVPETNGIQLQDLAARPTHHRMLTKDSKFDARMRVAAYWQMRMNDVPGCLARTSLPGGRDARFNVELTDPITEHLPVDATWRGAAGDFVVTLGAQCDAVPGRDASLPTLRATINAFTRFWLGVRPASGLAISDDLEGPDDLLDTLDHAVCLRDPQPGWDF